MASFNKVIVVGRLTRDPEQKTIGSGSSVTECGLAINESYKTKDGESKESTCFIDVSVWGKQGDNCAVYLSKGSQVLVEGRLQQDTWEKDGQKRSKHKLTADRVVFLDSKRDEGGASGAQDNNDETPF